MGDVIEFLRLFMEVEPKEISFIHMTIATIVTFVIFILLFVTKRYIQKLDIQFSISDLLIKFGVAFIIEFGMIWIYGPKVFVIAIVMGVLASIYIRNKLFSFLDTNVESAADHDLKLRMELAELKNKFKKNPYYSILEVLLYYGYISSIQKELVEAENIFKTPDDMAKEFLHKPILTEDQLDEAIGIMNVIRREGKILTREEALLLIVNMNNSENNKDNNNNTSVGE